jgi:phospho-N-acetylmuramoyl-pentapeptide-transferase
MAGYLLVPHNPHGAAWAVLLFTSAGALAGYLWYNAEPSAILMGDAGSRFLGLLVGIAVMVAGNPVLILVVAPVILANGGTGILKIVLLRGLKRCGMDVRSPAQLQAEAELAEEPHPHPRPKRVNGQPHYIVRLLHWIRFPLHDHCRHQLDWSNPQVLVRFVLIQAFLTPLLLVLLVKLR